MTKDLKEIKRLSQKDLSAHLNDIEALLYTDIEKQMSDFTKNIRALDEHLGNTTASSIAAANALSLSTQKKNIAIVVLSFLGVQIFVFLFSRSVGRTVNGIVHRLSSSSQSVSASSQQIASASSELASITNNQSSALQETSAAAEQISSMAAKNMDGLAHSKDLSHSNSEKSAEGRQAVLDMLQSMSEISEATNRISAQVESNNVQMNEIITAISNIDEKTRVINEIVFQTKLLSFNASVEAARAGEHGKGFSVVAEEVGNLAQRSGTSSMEISSLLASSTGRIKEIIASSRTNMERLINESSQKVAEGIKTAERCEAILSELNSKSSEVYKASEEVFGASQEQEKGVKEISSAVQTLDKSNQEIAVAASHSSQASENLYHQAVLLNGYVSELERFIKGGAVEGEPGKDPPRQEPLTSDLLQSQQASVSSRLAA